MKTLILITILSLALTACSTRNLALKNESVKYKVCWELKNGKNKGCGQFVSKDTAKTWADYGNKKYKNIRHWIKAEIKE